MKKFFKKFLDILYSAFCILIFFYIAILCIMFVLSGVIILILSLFHLNWLLEKYMNFMNAFPLPGDILNFFIDKILGLFS